MLFSFFKQNKNKQFNYTPRYYDERKERLDNLKRKYGKLEGEDYEEGNKTRHTRTSFRDDWKQNSKIKTNKNTRIRLLVIITFLLIATYIALNYLEIGII